MNSLKQSLDCVPLTPETTALENKGVESRENVGMSDRKTVINAVVKTCSWRHLVSEGFQWEVGGGIASASWEIPVDLKLGSGVAGMCGGTSQETTPAMELSLTRLMMGRTETKIQRTEMAWWWGGEQCEN